MTRLVIAIILGLALQSGAHALGGGGGGGGGGGDRESSSGQGGNRFLLFFNRSDSEDESVEEDEEDNDPRAFTLPALVVPMSADGRLTGFAYVNVRVRAADGQNVWTMQENAHYALDALVRASYRSSVSTPSGDGVDPERARAVWQATLQEVWGANSIDRIEIRASDTRLFRR